MTQDLEVLGHSCAGLARFQEAGGGCAPKITDDGHIGACDDTNKTPLTACPFCGTKWEHPTECYYCETGKWAGEPTNQHTVEGPK